MSKLGDEFSKASEAVAGLAARVDDQIDKANLQALAESLANIASQLPVDAAGALTNDGSGGLSWTP